MAEWKIKGAVEDIEQKSAQEQEQAVLDKAVEEGKIEPEAAGKEVDEVPKINLDELNKEKNAVQERETKEVPVEDAPGDSKEVEQEVQEQTETKETEEQNSPLELVEDEEKTVETNQPSVDERAAQVNKQPKAAEPEVVLPENVEKLVKFMEETGGSVEDFVLLNRDLSKYNDGDLLREYYKQSKPWDSQEVSEYMEDNFSYDEDDDPREIRSKKRAFKEELFNAKKFLEGNKEKYYADLKLKKQTDVPQEYKEALEYYNTYQQNAESSKQLTESFLQKTDNVFSQDFKGFDFQVGNNKYRYKVNNVNDTKTQQSDINNFVKQFLGDDGQIKDAKGYHKALFTARNADKLAEHFYEQGRADALRQSAKEAKNINMDPRQEGVIKTSTGQKFKVVSGDSSSKLKIKLRQ
tara:strand:+ start:213 stop:1436 length:1224 start_codon:yes stop_codon:yes gene_type:complete